MQPVGPALTVDGTASHPNGMACTDYGGMFGWYDKEAGRTMVGVMYWNQPISIADIPDGTSTTICVAEDTGRGWPYDSEWANGGNVFQQEGPINVLQHNEMWSDHPLGVNAAFCDGSARFLKETMDPKVVGAVCSRKGAEVIDGSQLP